MNQIEVHPYCFDNDIIECCQENGIIVQAFSPMGSGRNAKMFCKAKSRTFGKDQLSYFFGTTVTFFAVLDDEVIQLYPRPGLHCLVGREEDFCFDQI